MPMTGKKGDTLHIPKPIVVLFTTHQPGYFASVTETEVAINIDKHTSTAA